MKNVRKAPRSDLLRGNEVGPPVVEPPPGLYNPMEILALSRKKRSFCGPWVLMALTGKSFETVRAAVNRVRGREDHIGVMGTGRFELCRTLDGLGVRYEWVTHRYMEPGERVTLAALLRKRQDVNETMIVVAANHWILVRGKKVTCAIRRQWTWTSHAAKRRGVVDTVIRIVGKDEAKAERVASSVLAATAEARRRNLAKGRAKMAAMAEVNRLGIAVDHDATRETITLDAPTGMVFRLSGQEAEYITEPGDGSGWQEVIRMLQGMDSDALFEADPDAEGE